jgi:hypothetical protein
MSTYELSSELMDRCRAAASPEEILAIVEATYPEAHKGAVMGI